MLTGRAGMSPVMVGRAGPFAHLAGIVEAADVMTGDQPSVALVSGEAGIGKTRLVRELLATLPEATTTLVATAQPGSMGRPGDAVAGLIAADGGAAGDPGDQEAGAFQAVASALERGRTVLVIEDLHWIDAASANAIDRITQQRWPQLVVIGTYRPAELSRGQPGGELVLRLERRHAVEQVRLDRLDRTEVAALVAAIRGDQPPSAVVEAVYRRSGGVPFVVEELIRCCGPQSGAGDLLTVELPWSLEEAVQQQLAGLHAAERTVVEALAVYGRGAPFDALVHVTGVDDDAVLAALRSLTTAGVVVEVADDTFWFTHALVADAIEHQLLGRERRRLHERSFEAVRARPVVNFAALAHHAIGAGRYDEVPTIARKGGPKYLAKGHTFQALRLAADALGEAPNDPELLAVATEAAWRLNFLDEALGTAQRWERVAVEPADRIEAMRFVARLHGELEDAAAAAAARDALRSFAESLDAPELRGPARAALAQVHMLVGNSAEAISWAELARADADAAGDESTATRARVEAASAMIAVTSRAEATAAMHDAIDHARRLGDTVLLCRALSNSLELVPPSSPEGRAMRAELLEASRLVGIELLGMGVGLLWEVAAAYEDGDLAALRRAYAEGEQWWGARTDPNCWGLDWHAIYAFEEGRLDDAREQVARIREGVEHPHKARDKTLIELRLAAALGDSAAGADAFAALVGGRAVPDVNSALDDVVMATEAALAAGVPPARVRAELIDHWLGGHPSEENFRAHVDGLLLAAEGDHARAARALGAVLDEPEPGLARPLLGSMRTALAVALAATGDRAGARRAVRRVLDDDFARWPGVRRDRALDLARRLEGASMRPDGDLTGREREVAALLADGLTNGQLAERLFISPKTAAVHVSNILAKLGLSSRAEIAAWAVRHGIADARAS
jgi:DNA-binding CsgD family transcriptional regulator/tetratricopeptide (TPR) repeat protein